MKANAPKGSRTAAKERERILVGVDFSASSEEALKQVTIRPIRPEDEPLMVDFHASLSDESVHFRYFGFVSLAQRTRHEQLARACLNDPDGEIALVADRTNDSGEHEILGVVRLIKAESVNEAEFAIVVADAWQGIGLGTALLKALISVARRKKIRRVLGHILSDNAAMLHVSRKVGFRVAFDETEGEWEAELLLDCELLSQETPRLTQGSPRSCLARA